MRFGKPAIAIAIAALLTGCVTSPPAPTEHYYRLQPEQAGAPIRLPLSVNVRRFSADGLLRERAILYSDDNGHRVLKQHAYHYWMNAPASLLREYWYARLQVSSPGSTGQTVTSDLVLRGRLRRMERLLGDDGVDVALSVEMSLRESATGREVLKRGYEVVQRAPGPGVLDSIKAFEAALQSIHARFMVDLAALPSRFTRVNPEAERVSYDYPAP